MGDRMCVGCSCKAQQTRAGGVRNSRWMESGRGEREVQSSSGGRVEEWKDGGRGLVGFLAALDQPLCSTAPPPLAGCTVAFGPFNCDCVACAPESLWGVRKHVAEPSRQAIVFLLLLSSSHPPLCFFFPVRLSLPLLSPQLHRPSHTPVSP